MSQRQEVHPLVLRVMRLGAPQLADPVRSFAGGSLAPAGSTGLGSLVLPQGFGSLARGEKFSACIVAINGSGQVVPDVTMSCELVQGEDARQVLLPIQQGDAKDDKYVADTSVTTTPNDLKPGGMVRQVIEARVQRGGPHR